jgi:hypothetical protein
MISIAETLETNVSHDNTESSLSTGPVQHGEVSPDNGDDRKAAYENVSISISMGAIARANSMGTKLI